MLPTTILRGLASLGRGREVMPFVIPMGGLLSSDSIKYKRRPKGLLPDLPMEEEWPHVKRHMDEEAKKSNGRKKRTSGSGSY